MGVFREFSGALLAEDAGEISLLKAIEFTIGPEEHKKSSLSNMHKKQAPKAATKKGPGFWEKLGR